MKQFRVSDTPWAFDTISISMRDVEDNKKMSAIAIQYSSYIEGTIITPFISLTREEAQELANQLYQVGIQPSQLKGSTGQLSAIQYHLEDMRKIAFK